MIATYMLTIGFSGLAPLAHAQDLFERDLGRPWR
jgi:hypothetical protein